MHEPGSHTICWFVDRTSPVREILADVVRMSCPLIPEPLVREYVKDLLAGAQQFSYGTTRVTVEEMVICLPWAALTCTTERIPA